MGAFYSWIANRIDNIALMGLAIRILKNKIIFVSTKISVLKNLVIIPMYNEIENAENILRAVFDLKEQFHVLVIDDNSPDGTADVVKKLQQEYPEQLHLMEREGKLGLGTAYIAGFDWGIENGFDYICEMDADFSHNPKDLERFIQTVKETNADLVIGSRYVKGGSVKNWDYKRILLSYFASWYVNIVTWIGIKDTTAGFKCYSAELLKKINYHVIPFKGYAFQISMKFGAKKHKAKIVEIPITFIDRQFGTSKMSISIFKEAFTGVWKLRGLKL